MPQVAQLFEKTLQGWCVESICKNMDTLWCKDFLDKYYKIHHLTYVIGPFDSILPSLCEEIFSTLKRQKQLRRHHSYLLISVYQRRIDVSGIEVDLNLILKLVQERCYLLNQLVISRCMKLPLAQLNGLISTTTNLVSIEAASSNIGNEFVSAVGVYCSKLKYLDVSFTSVSNQGLTSLVREEDLDSVPNPRYGNCKHLLSLKINGCQRVTDVGAAIILEECQHLQIFDYENIVGAIKILLQNNTSAALKLRTLSCSSEHLQGEDLCAGVLMNPTAEKVHITTFPDLQSEAFFSLLEVPTLKELHVTNAEDLNPISFQDCLAPIMASLSSNLTCLHLSQLRDINVQLLRDECDNLEDLSLLWNLSYQSVQIEEPRRLYFPRLKTASIFSIHFDLGSEENLSNLCNADLVSILSSPSLVDVSLSRCSNLTDSTLAQVFEVHEFPYLKSLSLEHCHQVSYDGLCQVLEEPNRLDKVRFIQCREITRKDYTSYLHLSKQKKWNINVEWS